MLNLLNQKIAEKNTHLNSKDEPTPELMLEFARVYSELADLSIDGTDATDPVAPAVDIPLRVDDIELESVEISFKDGRLLDTPMDAAVQEACETAIQESVDAAKEPLKTYGDFYAEACIWIIPRSHREEDEIDEKRHDWAQEQYTKYLKEKDEVDTTGLIQESDIPTAKTISMTDDAVPHSIIMEFGTMPVKVPVTFTCTPGYNISQRQLDVLNIMEYCDVDYEVSFAAFQEQFIDDEDIAGFIQEGTSKSIKKAAKKAVKEANKAAKKEGYGKLTKDEKKAACTAVKSGLYAAASARAEEKGKTDKAKKYEAKADKYSVKFDKATEKGIGSRFQEEGYVLNGFDLIAQQMSVKQIHIPHQQPGTFTASIMVESDIGEDFTVEWSVSAEDVKAFMEAEDYSVSLLKDIRKDLDIASKQRISDDDRSRLMGNIKLLQESCPTTADKLSEVISQEGWTMESVDVVLEAADVVADMPKNVQDSISKAQSLTEAAGDPLTPSEVESKDKEVKKKGPAEVKQECGVKKGCAPGGVAKKTAIMEMAELEKVQETFTVRRSRDRFDDETEYYVEGYEEAEVEIVQEVRAPKGAGPEIKPAVSAIRAKIKGGGPNKYAVTPSNKWGRISSANDRFYQIIGHFQSTKKGGNVEEIKKYYKEQYADILGDNLTIGASKVSLSLGHTMVTWGLLVDLIQYYVRDVYVLTVDTKDSDSKVGPVKLEKDDVPAELKADIKKGVKSKKENIKELQEAYDIKTLGEYDKMFQEAVGFESDDVLSQMIQEGIDFGTPEGGEAAPAGAPSVTAGPPAEGAGGPPPIAGEVPDTGAGAVETPTEGAPAEDAVAADPNDVSDDIAANVGEITDGAGSPVEGEEAGTLEETEDPFNTNIEGETEDQAIDASLDDLDAEGAEELGSEEPVDIENMSIEDLLKMGEEKLKGMPIEELRTFLGEENLPSGDDTDLEEIKTESFVTAMGPMDVDDLKKLISLKGDAFVQEALFITKGNVNRELQNQLTAALAILNDSKMEFDQLIVAFGKQGKKLNRVLSKAAKMTKVYTDQDREQISKLNKILVDLLGELKSKTSDKAVLKGLLKSFASQSQSVNSIIQKPSGSKEEAAQESYIPVEFVQEFANSEFWKGLGFTHYTEAYMTSKDPEWLAAKEKLDKAIDDAKGNINDPKIQSLRTALADISTRNRKKYNAEQSKKKEEAA